MKEAFAFLKEWLLGARKRDTDGLAAARVEAGAADMLKEACQISPLGWALLTLSADPLFRRLPEAERIKAAETALKCGAEEAGRVRNRYGDRSVREITGEMGVEFGYVEKNRFGSFLYFSRYSSRPPRIEIFQTTLDEIRRVVASVGQPELQDRELIEDALIAHELFHHLESIHPELATSTFRIKTWRLAGYQAQSNLVSLGEIGAFSFAQELLRLPYFPRVLELAALSLKNGEAAGRLLARLKEWETVAAAAGEDSSGGQSHGEEEKGL